MTSAAQKRVSGARLFSPASLVMPSERMGLWVAPMRCPASLNAADLASDHPLVRSLGFDPALLEECESLLVKVFLSSGVPTTLEAFVLVGSELLHSHQTTHCASPVGYRSATLR